MNQKSENIAMRDVSRTGTLPGPSVFKRRLQKVEGSWVASALYYGLFNQKLYYCFMIPLGSSHIPVTNFELTAV